MSKYLRKWKRFIANLSPLKREKDSARRFYICLTWAVTLAVLIFVVATKIYHVPDEFQLFWGAFILLLFSIGGTGILLGVLLNIFEPKISFGMRLIWGLCFLIPGSIVVVLWGSFITMILKFLKMAMSL